VLNKIAKLKIFFLFNVIVAKKHFAWLISGTQNIVVRVQEVKIALLSFVRFAKTLCSGTRMKIQTLCGKIIQIPTLVDHVRKATSKANVLLLAAKRKLARQIPKLV